MDDRGYWRESPVIDKLRDEPNGSRNPERSNDRPRFVISFEIGSTVEIARGDGAKMLCIFERAEKNKVTLRPIDEKATPRPYFETADRVTLSDGTNPGVQARVWDNRNGKIVLRTLPVGM